MKQSMETHIKQLDGIFDALNKEAARVKFIVDKHKRAERDYWEYQRQYQLATHKGLTKFERKE